MADPSQKSYPMQKFLDGVSKQTFGRSRTESIEGNICVTCGGAANEFSNALSRQEYSISGMCQKCQDETFKPHDEYPDWIDDEPAF